MSFIELSVNDIAQANFEQKLVLIDIREENETAQGIIPGAICHPLSAFDPTLFEEQAGEGYAVIYCRSGRRTANLAHALLQSGHAEVRHLKGGILDWVAQGQPVVDASDP